MRGLLLKLCSWALVLGIAAPAQAFVCTRASTDGSSSQDGPALSWFNRSATYTFNAQGSAKLPLQGTFQVLRNSFLVWQNLVLAPSNVAQCGSLPGTDFTFFEADTPSSATWVGYNFLDPNSNANLLVFRDDTWPYTNSTVNAIDIIALTTTTYSALTGEIIDADIEFNSAGFAFVLDNPNDQQTDLMNTTVHEVGHFIGMAHCGAVSCGNQEVMEPTSAPGEIVKRQLKCDDRAGMVFKYPQGEANGYCTGTVDATCGSCAPPQNPTLLPTVALNDLSAGRLSCQAGGAPGWWACALWALARRRACLRRAATTLAGLLTLALLSACGGPECNGQPSTISADAPMIAAMALHGQVANDPWRIILATDFIDYDGNLGFGSVEFFTNHNTTALSSPPLNTIFDASGGVSYNATSGRLALPLRFAAATPNGAVLHLGTQLVDAAGNRSNCFIMDMTFNLSQSGSGSPLNE